MMEIEKRFAKADLGKIRRRKEVPEHIKRILQHAISYRDWKTPEALKKIDYSPLKELGASFYFNCAVQYLNGKKDVPLSIGAKGFLDSGKSKIPYIRPNDKVRRVERNYKYKETIKPKIEIREEHEPEQKLTSSFLYGCMVEDECIFVFKSEKELNSFVKGIKYAGKTYRTIHLDEDALKEE